jgi:hypothetical protein
MRFLIGLGCVALVTVVLLVQPAPKPPVETVDTVAGCVRKYWPGKPIEQWIDTPDMDAVCRSIMNNARQGNR